MGNKDNSGKQNAKFLGEIKEDGHTPEPWAIGQINPVVITANKERIAVAQKNGAYDEIGTCQENARRIVACVNFCAGVSTEMLQRNTLLGEMGKARKLAGELGKKLGEIPETSERYFIGTENGIADIEAPPSDN